MGKYLSFAVDFFLVAAVAAAALLTSPPEMTIVMEVLKVLIGLAGVVVTIFGIWVAVIFPAAVGKISSGVSRDKVPQLVKYDSLVVSLYRACFSLSACFFVFLLLSFFGSSGSWVRRFSVFFCWLGFISVVAALWSSLWSGESAVVLKINDAIKSGFLKRSRSRGRSK